MSVSSLQEPPAAETLAALAERLMDGGEVVQVGALSGGIRCSVHAAELVSPAGRRLSVVIKRYSEEFLREEPQAYRRERHVFTLLPRSAAPAPELLWADDDGALFGVPTLVMSQLPGDSLMTQMRELPRGDHRWLEQIAEALEEVHATPASAEELAALPTWGVREIGTAFLSDLDVADRDRRRGALSHGDEIWRVLSDLWPRLPSEPPVLVHGDFHPGNILWQDGRVTGVVDWSEAWSGARELDLAHMRWELALRFDLATADAFLAAYEAAAGRSIPAMALWDLMLVWRLALVLGSWIWFFELEGRTDGTRANLEARRHAFAAHALERLV